MLYQKMWVPNPPHHRPTPQCAAIVMSTCNYFDSASKTGGYLSSAAKQKSFKISIANK